MTSRKSYKLKRFLVYHKLAIFAIAAFVALSFFVSSTSVSSVYETENGGSPHEPPPPEHIKTPSAVRAIYMSSWVAGTPTIREKVLDFVNSSEANSVIIDIKDYTGKIAFAVDDPVLNKYESVEKRIRDIRELIDYLHGQHIYIIGRVAVFQDPHMAKKLPALAVQNKNGGIWRDRKGLAFIDPGAKEYWDYTVRVARVSEKVGFDEINFDYIRYPSDGQLALATYPHTGARLKPDVMEEFFKYLRSELSTLGVPISADIFGLATSADDDLGIGQVLERIVPHFDYISPMTYPSHYDPGFEGIKNPVAHPYEVMSLSVTRAIERMRAIGQDPKKLRPWIQDFDLGANYGVVEVKAQKKAIYDSGLDSWMAWDPSNKYTQEAYRPKSQ